MFGTAPIPEAGSMFNETRTHTSTCWWNAEEDRWVCASGAVSAAETIPAARTGATHVPLTSSNDG